MRGKAVICTLTAAASEHLKWIKLCVCITWHWMACRLEIYYLFKLMCMNAHLPAHSFVCICTRTETTTKIGLQSVFNRGESGSTSDLHSLEEPSQFSMFWFYFVFSSAFKIYYDFYPYSMVYRINIRSMRQS